MAQGQATEAEDEAARHLFHEAMIRDGEIERDRFFVETDARLGQAAEGFLQKTVALYRITLGWHMLLITHVDEIWPTKGKRQIMLSRTEFENATETIRELSTEKIIPHLIKVIQTIQWILDSCWSRGFIKIFQQIMHPGDVSSEHLRVHMDEMYAMKTIANYQALVLAGDAA